MTVDWQCVMEILRDTAELSNMHTPCYNRHTVNDTTEAAIGVLIIKLQITGKGQNVTIPVEL